MNNNECIVFKSEKKMGKRHFTSKKTNSFHFKVRKPKKVMKLHRRLRMAVERMLEEGVKCATIDVRLKFLLQKHETSSLQGHRSDEICIQMVIGLANCYVPSEVEKYEKIYADLVKVEDLLRQKCSGLDMLYTTFRAFYNELSNNSRVLSPAMSIVLRLISVEMIPDVVQWIFNSGFKEEKLHMALHNLVLWLTQSTHTPNLSPMIISYMEALEEKNFLAVLIEETQEQIDNLFKSLIIPEFRKNAGEVVLHMLSRSKHLPEAMYKIKPFIKHVATSLKEENSEGSLLYLRKLAAIWYPLKDGSPQQKEIYEILEPITGTYVSKEDKKKLKVLIHKNKKSWFLKDIKSPGFKVGLNNLGNTCYLNSVLQALYMTKNFRNNILMFDDSDMPLYRDLQELFILLQHSRYAALSPDRIVDMAVLAGFQINYQHDSSEFLSYLLNKLHEQAVEGLRETNKSATSNEMKDMTNTIVGQSFGGRSISISKCGKCMSQSKKIDDFKEIPLCFPDEKENEYFVSSLLESYLQPEKLCGQNQYFCNKCGLTDGEKVTRILQAPQTLILTLKHFQYDIRSQKITKLLHRVQLEECIQLNDVSYELYAAIVHDGWNADSGHYYTLAKDAGDWYEFNDCVVKRMKKSHIYELKPSRTPYILFYRSQESEEPKNLKKRNLPRRLRKFLRHELAENMKDENYRLQTSLYNIRRNMNKKYLYSGCKGQS